MSSTKPPPQTPPAEPLFKLEDYWPAGEMIPCWGRLHECPLYPGDRITYFYFSRKRKNVGCGDCDIFQARYKLAKRVAKRVAKEEAERKRRWWREQYELASDTDEEILAALYKESEDREE